MIVNLDFIFLIIVDLDDVLSKLVIVGFFFIFWQDEVINWD